MGRLIDESLLQEKLALIPMEERTFRRTVEELENAPTVEARLKADLEAILVELQLEIEEKHREEEFMNDWNNGYNSCLVDGYNFIQQKINSLKENEDGNK